MNMPQPPETDQQSFCTTAAGPLELGYGRMQALVVYPAEKRFLSDLDFNYGTVSVLPATS